MFGSRWIKRWVRSRSTAIPRNKAEVWERRLAFTYFFAAWNLLAIIGYKYYKSNKAHLLKDDETLAEKIARNSNMKNVTIYRMKNLSYEGKRDVDVEELADKHKERQKEIFESLS